MRQRYVGMMLVFYVLCVGAMAQEQPTPSDASLEFILHPVWDGFSIYNSDYANREIVFKKEPVYAGSKVSRRALYLDKEKSAFIGMACDFAADALYIDRNQNLDLTDDGPCMTTRVHGGGVDPVFENVSIELIHGGIPVQYTMKMCFRHDRNYFYAYVHSGWQADIELAGKPCKIGVADNFDGILDSNDCFLFDHERNREARKGMGSVDELSLPQWIYFEGQSYHVNCAFRIVDNDTVVVATFTPVTEDLMDITFEGQYVSRIIVYDQFAETCGILDWPPS